MRISGRCFCQAGGVSGTRKDRVRHPASRQSGNSGADPTLAGASYRMVTQSSVGFVDYISCYSPEGKTIYKCSQDLGALMAKGAEVLVGTVSRLSRKPEGPEGQQKSTYIGKKVGSV